MPTHLFILFIILHSAQRAIPDLLQKLAEDLSPIKTFVAIGGLYLYNGSPHTEISKRMLCPPLELRNEVQHVQILLFNSLYFCGLPFI